MDRLLLEAEKFTNIHTLIKYLPTTQLSYKNNLNTFFQRFNLNIPSQLSIQWGPISDVGMAAKLLGQNRNKIIGGAHAQSLDSCLSSLDVLLQIPQAVVSSTVVPNKNVVGNDETIADQGSVTLRKVIADILGKFCTLRISSNSSW